MKSEKMLDAIGNIRDEWVEEAHAAQPHRRRRITLLAAALVITLVLSVGAFATADTNGFLELLSAVSPGLAQALKPVQLSCVDNGIELSVISADVQGDTAHVFLGLRDLEGNRIDGTCDLYDSYHLDLPGDSIIGHCSFSHFDEETKTALFVVELSRGDGEPIPKKKFTFSLRQFLSGKREWKGILEPDRTLIRSVPQTTREFVMRGMSYSDEDYLISEVMIPGSSLLEPVKGVHMTAMGWVDGMLRIQLYYDRIHETDNHGFITLADADGRQVFPDYSIGFWDKERIGSYQEYLFRVSPDEIAQLEILGEFSAADQLHKGDWQITFALEEED